MTRHRFDPRDLAAIAVGGLAGSTLRWSLTRPSQADDGGWFMYAPNSSVDFAPLARSSWSWMPWRTLPWQTLLVNGLGCLLLGVATALLARARGPRRALLALATGFCGSLTTFSTFAVEIASLLRGNLVTVANDAFAAKLPADAGTAIVYGVLSIAVGAGTFVAGRWFARHVPPRVR